MTKVKTSVIIDPKRSTPNTPAGAGLVSFEIDGLLSKLVVKLSAKRNGWAGGSVWVQSASDLMASDEKLVSLDAKAIYSEIDKQLQQLHYADLVEFGGDIAPLKGHISSINNELGRLVIPFLMSVNSAGFVDDKLALKEMSGSGVKFFDHTYGDMYLLFTPPVVHSTS